MTLDICLSDTRIAVIGLGYVGLPLAVEFAKRGAVVGFDLNATRVDELSEGHDRTLEVGSEDLIAATQLTFSADPASLNECNVYIVTVPTPIDEHRQPDLTPLYKASKTVGRALNNGDIVIYESTVYPGATEEDCVPVLECASGLTFNRDFFVGYSPERINPGDKEHRLPDILKITSGSTPEAAEFVDALYDSIITAGTFKATSIRVAEAAKVIENTQRDLNIALINELAIIFNKMDINTTDVLEAAGTKWNFLPFRPGMVGGHCIGVDPYYLTHKAQAIGYHPEIILAGRRVNDGMSRYIAGQMVKAMLMSGQQVRGSRVLVLGLTFKENCPDLRNSKVFDLIHELEQYAIDVDAHDPWITPEDAQSLDSITVVDAPAPNGYDGIIAAVAHRDFEERPSDWISGLARDENTVIYDLKGWLPSSLATLRL